MKSVTIGLILSSCITITSSAVAEHGIFAFAEPTTPGSAGFGWPNADKNCFQASWAQMVNHCTQRKLLVIPLATLTQHSSGTARTLHVYARGWSSTLDAGRTSCSYLECDAYNNCWQSPAKSTSGTDVVTMLFGNFYLEVYHTVQVECLVAAKSGPNTGSVILIYDHTEEN